MGLRFYSIYDVPNLRVSLTYTCTLISLLNYLGRTGIHRQDLPEDYTYRWFKACRSVWTAKLNDFRGFRSDSAQLCERYFIDFRYSYHQLMHLYAVNKFANVTSPN